jgi:uncharacterized membrane-anchored protein
MTNNNTLDQSSHPDLAQSDAPALPGITPYKAYFRTGLMFVLAIGVQLAILTTLVAVPMYTLSTGQLVRVRATLVDPWDIFRGDYVTLQFGDLGTVDGSSFHQGDSIYVVARRQGGFVSAERAYHQMPVIDSSKQIVLKGTVEAAGPGTRNINVKYGIERYYIPERTGQQYQGVHQLVAQVYVDNFGNCVLKSVQPAGAEAR